MTCGKLDDMNTGIAYRQLEDTDGAAFAELSENSPDTGIVGVVPKYHIDAFQEISLNHENVIGVVANTSGFQGIVGAGLIGFGKCFFEDNYVDYALLHSLIVHPEFRRQGIATELANRRYKLALEKIGNDALILAGIQKGNSGSLATSQKWCQQISGIIQSNVVRMRNKPPVHNENITVRLAELNDLDEIIRHQNNFYQNYNFYSPDSPEKLIDWLAQTPFETPFRHYCVAVDSQANILAGLVIKEQYRLVSMQITRMPAWANFINRFLSIVPPDGILKQLSIEKFWFTENRLEEARHLWETIRWEWRDRGSSFVYMFDPRSPISEALRLPRWMPKSSFTFAIGGSKKMSKERLVYSM